MKRNGNVSVVILCVLVVLLIAASLGLVIRVQRTEAAWTERFNQELLNNAQSRSVERQWVNKSTEAILLNTVDWDNQLRNETDGILNDILDYVHNIYAEGLERDRIHNNTNVVILELIEKLQNQVGEPWAADHQQMQDATVWIVRLHAKCPDDAPCAEHFRYSGQEPPEVCSWGSGVFIGDNKIMTAHHVVDSLNLMDGRWAVKYQGETYAITGLHLDPDSDLATIDTEEIPELFIPELLGRDIRLGETVVIVGTPSVTSNPSDLHLRMTQGIVSHLDRGDDDPRFHGWGVLLGSDASSGSGNSGGPVFIEGKLAALLVGGLGGRVSDMSLILPVDEFD